MKTISKNALLFALLVCCNQTIKSAAAAAAAVEYPGIEKSTIQNWLVELQKAEKNGIADKKDTNPKEYRGLVDLIESIEAANKQREEAERRERREFLFRIPSLVNKRVETLIKELSKQLDIETKEEIKRKLQEKKLQNFTEQFQITADSLAVMTTESFTSIAKELYRAKMHPFFSRNLDLFELCNLSPEEQKTHVESLKEIEQVALLKSLNPLCEANNQFFGGLNALLPKDPDKCSYEQAAIPQEILKKIRGPLNISSLYKSLHDAIYPPSQYK